MTENSNEVVKNQNSVSNSTENQPTQKKGKFNPQKLFRVFLVAAAVILAAGGISLLVYKYKDRVVAARVNNSFITKYALRKKVMKTYAANMVEEMITERLIRQKLDQEGVLVPEGGLAARTEEIESQVKGAFDMSLDEYLKQQDISRKDFEDNITLQLRIEEYLASRVDITDEEVDSFIEENGQMLTGETEEEKREEAVEILIDQEINQQFQGWLQELREEAKIVNYLE